MSQLLITKKKYNFKLGYIIKIGREFFELLGIEPFTHYELIASVAAGVAQTQNFNANLTPSSGYMYWIEKMGIDGALGFQLTFPAVPRWTVHGLRRYIYRHRASFTNAIHMPILVRNPQFPRFTYFNPELAAKVGIMFFEGERWIVKPTAESNVYTDLTSYTDLNIGEG
jgi:hypothetical protein